jgi:hypothetical protein
MVKMKRNVFNKLFLIFLFISIHARELNADRRLGIKMVLVPYGKITINNTSFGVEKSEEFDVGFSLYGEGTIGRYLAIGGIIRVIPVDIKWDVYESDYYYNDNRVGIEYHLNPYFKFRYPFSKSAEVYLSFEGGLSVVDFFEFGECFCLDSSCGCDYMEELKTQTGFNLSGTGGIKFNITDKGSPAKVFLLFEGGYSWSTVYPAGMDYISFQKVLINLGLGLDF